MIAFDADCTYTERVFLHRKSFLTYSMNTSEMRNAHVAIKFNLCTLVILPYNLSSIIKSSKTEQVQK